MMKTAIEDACKAGCRYFHQGESGTSKGIADCRVPGHRRSARRAAGWVAILIILIWIDSQKISPVLT